MMTVFDMPSCLQGHEGSYFISNSNTPSALPLSFGSHQLTLIRHRTALLSGQGEGSTHSHTDKHTVKH